MNTLHGYVVHPAADIFPMMSDEELKVLAASIAAEGLHMPVIVNYDESVLIDGRNRLRACEMVQAQTGVDPLVTQALPEMAEEEVLNYVVAANLHRRHLTTGQKAMVAAELEPMYAEAAKEQVGGRPRKGEEKPRANSPEVSAEQRRSREKAAKAVGASGRSVSDAKALKEAAPDLAKEVAKGERTLNSATQEAKARKAEKEPPPPPPPAPAALPGREWAAPQYHPRHQEVVDLYLQGMSMNEIGEKTGLGRNVRHIIEREAIEREARADTVVVDWDSLPGKVKDREAVIRRSVLREVEEEVDARAQAAVDALMEETWRIVQREKAAAAIVLKNRGGVFTRPQYNLIRACLHPDRSVSDEKLTEAFNIFNEAEVSLLKEKDAPRVTTLPPPGGLKRKVAR